MGDRMVRVHLVHQPDLDPVPHPELPVDRGVGSAGTAIHELPHHVGGGGQPVHRHHVVFPLDTTRGAVPVALGTVVGVAALRRHLAVVAMAAVLGRTPHLVVGVTAVPTSCLVGHLALVAGVVIVGLVLHGG